VLDDLFEIAFQRFSQCANPELAVERLLGLEHLDELLQQFAGERGKVIDDVEGVFDLVGDTGRELAERSQLALDDQLLLRGLEPLKGGFRFGPRLRDLGLTLLLLGDVSVDADMRTVLHLVVADL
jgi:hypothetical protein